AALARLVEAAARALPAAAGSDRDRLDLVLRAHDMLECRTELDGEPPVGDEDDTDHRSSPRAPIDAPHERAPIMTMLSPGARGFLPTYAKVAMQQEGLPAA